MEIKDILLNNRLKVSSYTCLFWFNDNYTAIIHSEGDNEFNDYDIILKKTILPHGTHRSFSVDSPYSMPRGRIEVEGGNVIITVGENCPENAVEKIIGEYGLGRYRNMLVVRRNKFWDKRM